jgi:outer membrane protein assembly factor BamB
LSPTTHKGDWTTYHRDGARSGVAPHVTPVGKLAVAWRAHLDGAVYGEPLTVGDSVFVATENDSIYSLDRGTEHTQWRAHVGTPVPLSELPCGNIDPLGITGTPVIDRASKRIFAVAETTGFHHVLVGIDLATGRVEVRRDLPTPDGHPRFDQQRPALTLAHGRVYVSFGGLFGDCGTYIGSVVGVATSGRGPTVTYRVPTANNGAIWATGGPVITSKGNLLVSVGNGAATSDSQPYDGSDSVVELSPGLRRLGFFAPRSWAQDNAGDLDLGSLTPALTGHGRVLIAGKRGTAYLFDVDHLGGISGALADRQLCRGFGTPAHRGDMVYLPCVDGGLAAVDTSGDDIRVLWRGPADGKGSPTIGAGTVWAASWDTGTLYALDAQTGAVREQLDTDATLPHFVSPSLSRNLVLLGTTDGVVAITH